jgi:hypothetical protein
MLAVLITADAVRIGERFAVTFQRTLRIPDDGRDYPLPPGLGRLPVLNVADYPRVPPEWRSRGGAFIPMYQREALWLGFHAAHWKPNAVKIAIGGFNPVSGDPDAPRLRSDPQDYLVCPTQPWLDGINTGAGSVRQFVAMPLGAGYSVEASLAGAETRGGIQITVFEPKPGRFPDQPPPVRDRGGPMQASAKTANAAMGLGAGGTLRQKIYPDPYGIDAWDQKNYGRAFVHIVNSAQFADITGAAPPPTPIDAEVYTKHGLPWFDLYDEGAGDLAPSPALIGVKTIAERDAEREIPAAQDSFDVPADQIEQIHRRDAQREASATHPRNRPRRNR